MSLDLTILNSQPMQMGKPQINPLDHPPGLAVVLRGYKNESARLCGGYARAKAPTIIKNKDVLN